jgi:hypothetical protein
MGRQWGECSSIALARLAAKVASLTRAVYAQKCRRAYAKLDGLQPPVAVSKTLHRQNFTDPIQHSISFLVSLTLWK